MYRSLMENCDSGASIYKADSPGFALCANSTLTLQFRGDKKRTISFRTFSNLDFLLFCNFLSQTAQSRGNTAALIAGYFGRVRAKNDPLEQGS